MAEQDSTFTAAAGEKFLGLVRKINTELDRLPKAVASIGRDIGLSIQTNHLRSLSRQVMAAREDFSGLAGSLAGAAGKGQSSWSVLVSSARKGAEAVSAQFEKHLSVATLKTRFDAFGGQVKTVHERISGLAGSLAGVAGQGVSASSSLLVSLGRKTATATAEFERSQAILTTIMGSGKAEASMDWIAKFTRKTPFELGSVTQAFMTLKGEGIDPMDGTLQTLGDAAAATGKPLNELAEAFADGVGGDSKALKKLGITLKKTQGDMMSMTFTDKDGQERTVEAAKKDAAAMQAAVLGVLKAKGFDGTLDNLSKTWGGLWTSLQHSLSDFLRMIGGSKAFDPLKARLQSVVDLLGRWAEDGTLKAWAERVAGTLVQLFTAVEARLAGVDWGEVFTTVTTALSDFVGWVQRAVAYVGGWENAVLILAAVLNANLLVSLVGLAGQFAGLVPLVGRVFMAVGSLLMANPVAALIGGIAVAVYLIHEHWGNLPAFFTSLWSAIASLAQMAADALRAAWEGVSTWFSGLWEGVRAAFEEGFVDGIVHLIENFSILPYIARFIREALLFITGVDLYAIGAEWIGGLWDGIKAKWTELASWLTGAFKSLTDWMPDWAKDKLGITAPSGTPAVPAANENRSAVERVAAPRSTALAAGMMAATLAAVPVAASPAVPVAASSAVPMVANAGRLPEAACAVPGAAVPMALPSPVSAPITAPPVSAPSSGTVVNAPVAVSITVNGMADIDVLRLETENAVRRALGEWTARQQSDAEASLFDL